MTYFFRSLLFLFTLTNLFGTKNTLGQNKIDNFIDTLRLKSNQARISFYVDFWKSEMQITGGLIKTKEGLDTIFQFIGKPTSESCNLKSMKVIPDGEITFYNDSLLIGHIEFVLSDKCKGIYTGFFTNNRKKYQMTFLGYTTLLNLKKRYLPKKKNLR